MQRDDPESCQVINYRSRGVESDLECAQHIRGKDMDIEKH